MMRPGTLQLRSAALPRAATGGALACGIGVVAGVSVSWLDFWIVGPTAGLALLFLARDTAWGWRTLFGATVVLLTASEGGILADGLPAIAPFAVATCLLVLTALELRRDTWPTLTTRQKNYIQVFILFLAFGLASTAWSVDAGTTVAQATAAVVVFGIPLTAMIGRWRSHRRLVGDLTLMYWLVVVTVAVGFVWEPPDVAGVVRFSGLFANPNSLGSIAALAFGLGFGVSAVSKRRWLYAPGQLVLGAAAAVSQSRAGLSAVVFAWLWTFLWKPGERTRVVAAVLAGGIAASSIIIAYGAPLRPSLAATFQRFDPTATDQFTYLSSREDIWRAAISVWAESPLVGHGYRVGEALFTQRQGHDFLDGVRADTAHSGPLQILVETGVVGLALVAAMLVIALRGKPPDALHERQVWIGTTAAVVAGLSTQMMRSSILAVGSIFSLLFWIVVATSLQLSTSSSARSEVGDSARPGRPVERPERA